MGFFQKVVTGFSIPKSFLYGQLKMSVLMRLEQH